MTTTTPTPTTAAGLGSDNAIKQWCLYLLECANGALYAGITNDLAARVEAHRTGRGAKFTRANPPIRVVASCDFPDRAAASRAEWAVKQLPRCRKVAFLAGCATATAAPAVA
jgi:putative endonuclease